MRARHLTTAYPGNIGLLVDERTVICMPFTEPAGLAPSDVAGTLEDAHAGNPDVVATGAWASSTTRTFGDPSYVLAHRDRDGRSSLLTRDMTVQFVLAASSLATGILFARGEGTGPDYRAAMVELDTLVAGTLRVRWSWQDTAGVVFADAWQSFEHTPLSPFLLTMTRRWESPSSVVLRYYVGEDLLAETTSTVGEIGGSTTGITTIGGDFSGPDGPGVYLDEIKVTDHEMSPEEVRATWRRLSEFQPNGVEMMQDLAPRGAPIATDPAARVQRLLRFVGQGLGLATARIEQMRDILPDRAYGPALLAWERICRLTTRPYESLEARRQRVMAHLRRKGLTISNIQGALRELLDLDPEDIEILNFSNTYTDAFASIRAERWWALPAASWTVAAGAARVQAAAAADIRWDGANRLGPTMIMPIHSATESYFAAKVTPTALPTDGEAGLVLRQGARSDFLFVGLRNNGGTYQAVYQRFRGGVAIDASPVVLATSGLTPAAHWFRLDRDPASGIVNAGEAEHRIRWSTDGASYSSLADLVWVNDHDWIGFYARGADSSLAGALDVRFSEFLARTPRGTRPFRWYAYRDPGLPGNPDVTSAQALLRRFRHAYTEATVITTKSLLCDDTASGCDLGPMGAI